jgi:uncharacterized protein with PQ loop repeat
MSNVVLNYVIPAFGDVISTLLYLSPLHEGYKILKTQKIGEFDLIPYIMMIFNNLVWSIYALGLPSPSQFFVIIPNFFGLVSAALVLSWTSHLASEQTRKRLQMIIAFITGVYIPLVYAIQVSCTPERRQNIFSVFTLIVQFCFLGSPLANTMKIVRQKDASSIHLPLTVLMLTSCTLWALYGFVLMDKTVYAPNCISCAIVSLQIILKLIFPNKKRDTEAEPQTRQPNGPQFDDKM